MVFALEGLSLHWSVESERKDSPLPALSDLQLETVKERAFVFRLTLAWS